MTLADLTTRWAARRDEWRALGVHVDGAAVAGEILADLHALLVDQAAGDVTIAEASRLGGYSVDHLQRLVASGQLANVGRKHRPRIRRSDVPTKPGHTLPTDAEAGHFSDRRRIVASVATGNEEDS